MTPHHEPHGFPYCLLFGGASALVLQDPKNKGFYLMTGALTGGYVS